MIPAIPRQVPREHRLVTLKHIPNDRSVQAATLTHLTIPLYEWTALGIANLKSPVTSALINWRNITRSNIADQTLPEMSAGYDPLVLNIPANLLMPFVNGNDSPDIPIFDHVSQSYGRRG